MFAKMNCEGKSVDIDVHVYFAPTKKEVERSLLAPQQEQHQIYDTSVSRDTHYPKYLMYLSL